MKSENSSRELKSLIRPPRNEKYHFYTNYFDQAEKPATIHYYLTRKFDFLVFFMSEASEKIRKSTLLIKILV